MISGEAVAEACAVADEVGVLVLLVVDLVADPPVAVADGEATTGIRAWGARGAAAAASVIKVAIGAAVMAAPGDGAPQVVPGEALLRCGDQGAWVSELFILIRIN